MDCGWLCCNPNSEYFFQLRQPMLVLCLCLESFFHLDMLEDEHCLSVGGFDWAIFTYIFWAIFGIVLIC